MDILSDVKISGDLTVKNATFSTGRISDTLTVDKSFESLKSVSAESFCVGGMLHFNRNGITTYTDSVFILKSQNGNFGFGINAVGEPFLMNSNGTEYLTRSNSTYFTEVLPIGCTRFIIAGGGCPNPEAPKSIGNVPLVSIFGCIDGKLKRVEIDYEIGGCSGLGRNLIGQLSTPLDYCMQLEISII